MEITEQIIKKTAEMINGILLEHREQISEAYSNQDEIIEIKTAVRYSFNKGKFKIQTKINFVTDRIKADKVVWYDPDQRKMFEEFPKDVSADAK
jgi:hypothetical protein